MVCNSKSNKENCCFASFVVNKEFDVVLSHCQSDPNIKHDDNNNSNMQKGCDDILMVF